MGLRLLRWGVVGYWAVLTLVLLLPDPLDPFGGGHGFTSVLERLSGYAVHFSSFLVLGAWLLVALNGRLPARGQRVFFTLAAVAVYAVGTEALQLAVPQRTFDLWDILANLAGIAAAGAVWRTWLRRPERPFPSADDAGAEAGAASGYRLQASGTASEARSP